MEATTPTQLIDARGRPLADLRISVTDRCNFRCGYCMPREHFGKDHPFLPRSELLSFEEISRVARVLVKLGVRKLRLTGGEPLLRSELPHLVAMLAEIPNVDLALTTNGSLLARHAESLARAGLSRVTVSLDAITPEAFRLMTDAPYSVDDVLNGIDAAARAGLGPVKINAVIRRGMNDGEIPLLAERFRGTGHIVRFIEYMDVGITNGWKLDQVVRADEIVSRISRDFELEPIEQNYPGEVARRYRYRDGKGEVGVIASVTQPFCGACQRLRISSEGKLYTCLFGGMGYDLRARIRDGASDGELTDAVTALWRARTDRYSEQRSEKTRSLPRIEMSYIGG